MKIRLYREVYLICCMLAVIAFTGCDKNTYDEETIILLGTESYVVPLTDMLPDSHEADFMSHIGNITEGFIPPNIDGEYLISEKEFCYSNLVNVFDNHDMHLRVSNQHNRVAAVELYEEGTVVTDTAFIMGTGPMFTLYFTEQKEIVVMGNTSRVDRCVVITGEKTDAGIKNLIFANIILNVVQNDNPFIDPFEPGHYFIYRDKDGLSENFEWFDNR